MACLVFPLVQRAVGRSLWFFPYRAVAFTVSVFTERLPASLQAGGVPVTVPKARLQAFMQCPRALPCRHAATKPFLAHAEFGRGHRRCVSRRKRRQRFSNLPLAQLVHMRQPVMKLHLLRDLLDSPKSYPLQIEPIVLYITVQEREMQATCQIMCQQRKRVLSVVSKHTEGVSRCHRL